MIDLVIISTLKRPELFSQTLDSIKDNISNPDIISNLVMVFDNPELWVHQPCKDGEGATVICTQSQYGASRCRNIGAGAIPKYRRGSHVMFLDDDVFMCKGWDTKMMELAKMLPPSIISSHAHPFNHGELHSYEMSVGQSVPLPWQREYTVPLVISTVCMMMPWSLWDDVGCFAEPGGPGGSEDYDYCMRAKAKDYGFAVTEPQCVLHTGVTSSSGKPIVGADLVRENNLRLEKIYGLTGKVRYK